MKVIIKPASNFAELQKQFCITNCTYIIGIEQQTYGTSNSPLIIPENSTLIFEKGKFIGGYVRLDDTQQNDVHYTVWDNVEISGTSKDYIWKNFKNDIIRPEWFGAIGDGVHDDAKALQQAIKIASACGSIVRLSARRYLITETIHILSGTHIEGTLQGSFDRNVHTGSSIEANLTSDDIALDINSNYKEEGIEVDLSGCYKFILKDFGLINKKIDTPSVGIRLYSEGEKASPRNGAIENLFVNSFDTGFRLNALSYVKFHNISIGFCRMAIHIAQTGLYLEFGWFSNIYINTDTPKAIGIKIENGNNLYFNEIDINDCEYGFWINVLTSIFNLFANRFNITRCIYSMKFHAASEYMTRSKISEISIYGTPDDGYGILFSRNNHYGFDECVFTDLFDAFPTQADFIRIEDMGMSSSVFDRLRTYNKISGLTHVKKIGILSIPNYGEFIIPAGTINNFSHNVTTRSPFDFTPIIIVSPRRNFGISSTCSNTQSGNLSINISFQGVLQEPLLITYFFPQL